MTYCLDTNILIELTKQRPEAQNWFTSMGPADYAVPGIVAMELVAGARDKVELAGIRSFLKSFSIVWPTPLEQERAFDLLVTRRLSDGLDVPDAFIAATCLQRSLRLYTLNVKHFRGIQGLDVHRPYVRAS